MSQNDHHHYVVPSPKDEEAAVVNHRAVDVERSEDRSVSGRSETTLAPTIPVPHRIQPDYDDYHANIKGH